MQELTEEQLADCSAQLTKLRLELQELLNLGKDATQTVGLDQSKVGRLSRMDALQQQAMAKANQAQHQARLRKVNRALQDIASGDYGYCLECGSPIGFARLEARPESSHCVACQERLENS